MGNKKGGGGQMEEVKIIIAEDDLGHATLIKKNLVRAGLTNEIIHFTDGQKTLDFLLRSKNGVASYLLLLDIKMPIMDGLELLQVLKSHEELKKIPIIIITTTDDPDEVQLCHRLGCNSYIAKPVDPNKFMEAIKQLGLFMKIVQIPKINGG